MITVLDYPVKPVGWAHQAWENDRVIEQVLKTEPEWYTTKLLGKLMRDEKGCQIWQGYLKNGYGKLDAPYSMRIFKNFGIHRIRWLAERGPLALGWLPDHLCKVHSCGNIEHLEAVPFVTNVQRGSSFSAQNAKKTQCAAGHDLSDPANWVDYEAERGERRCKRCTSARKHVAHVLQIEARNQTGMTQEQYISTHGQSLQALIDAVGGTVTAVDIVQRLAQPWAIETVSLGSGIWADFAKNAVRTVPPSRLGTE